MKTNEKEKQAKIPTSKVHHMIMRHWTYMRMKIVAAGIVFGEKEKKNYHESHAWDSLKTTSWLFDQNSLPHHVYSQGRTSVVEVPGTPWWPEDYKRTYKSESIYCGGMWFTAYISPSTLGSSSLICKYLNAPYEYFIIK